MRKPWSGPWSRWDPVQWRFLTAVQCSSTKINLLQCRYRNLRSVYRKFGMLQNKTHQPLLSILSEKGCPNKAAVNTSSITRKDIVSPKDVKPASTAFTNRTTAAVWLKNISPNNVSILAQKVKENTDTRRIIVFSRPRNCSASWCDQRFCNIHRQTLSALYITMWMKAQQFSQLHNDQSVHPPNLF